MDQPTVDKQEAYQSAERLGQLQAQQTEERTKMTTDIRRELSVEQFDKLKGLSAELAKKLREKGPPKRKKVN